MTNANDLLREIRRHNSSGLTKDMQSRIDEVLALHSEPVAAGTQQRRERWIQNIDAAIKCGLPKELARNLNNSKKEIENSIRYGGTQRLRDRIAELEAMLGQPAPAPAQDELTRLRELSVENILIEVVPGDGSGHEVYAKSVADVESAFTEYFDRIEDLESELANRPAQTEQQPVVIPPMVEFDDMVNRLFELDADARKYCARHWLLSMWKATLNRVCELNAAPIAPPAPQLEQGGLPDELFDGHAVYQEAVRHRRDSGLVVRTSPENVSDALDAVVRLIKSRLAAQGGER